jgi:hypothetical protein
LSPAEHALTLLPNLGGEEGDDWRRQAAQPAVASAASLWASLFGASAQIDGRPASPHARPAFDWLPDEAGALAWWSDARAAAELAGQRWHGPPPEVVAQVHDKAFALEHGPTPAALRGIARSFDPDELADADAALAAVAATLESWPSELREHFCLKPRFGSSGRGRCVGRGETPDTPALRGALPRLARCGGAILEPWLDRSVDLSVAFHIGDASAGPPLELLGSLSSICTGAGVPRGHRGEVDQRGRVHCGSRFDDALREAGSELALAAFEAGYRGPCGIDAFSYRSRDGQEVLRPAVELNARFTMGIAVLGCLRRARQALRAALAIEADMRVAVVVAYQAPDRDWREFDAEVVLPIEVCPPVDPERGPAILAAHDAERLDPVVAALAETPANGSPDPL